MRDISPDHLMAPAARMLSVFHRIRRPLLAAALLFGFLAVVPFSFAQGSFTVQVGSTVPPQVLAAHTDTWLFHKGTNAPPLGWQTNADSTFDNAWVAGPGGFGYANNSAEVALVQTPLPDMQDTYTTFYIRRSFEVASQVDPASVLQLSLDWDDGFVAWLDGVELSPRMNAPGAVGTEPDFFSLATTNHESSRGDTSAQPAMAFSLGPVGDRLQPGRHVLSIMGLNQATNSSDFILIPGLTLTGPPSGIVDGAYLSIVRSNQVTLSGTNTIPGSTAVLVNGVAATFDKASGTWSMELSLSPGLNRVLCQAVGALGDQLYVTNKDIVSEIASTRVGGTLDPVTAWTSSMGVIHVTNSLIVPPGGSLAIGPGCVLLLDPGVNLLVTNGTLTAGGTADAPILFAPSDGTSVWGGLIASGPAGQLECRSIETIAGHVELFDGAAARLEDSYLHDYTVSTPPIIHTLGQPAHCALTIRRSHVNRYYEILSQLSTNLFEDSLFEHLATGGDGIDFDGAQPGSIIRRCTVRHGRFTNIDALDMGEFAGGESSRGVLIDSCLLYDFVDKGVSMGVQVDATVTNCLIHHVDAGIAVKDLSTAGIYGCTIASNNFGFNCYNKADPASPAGGGLITNSFNNILWGNGASLALLNGSTLQASFSDFQGATVPGTGNLTLDPLWQAPAASDFRLGPASPLLGAGLHGADLGAAFPVGAPMASSHPAIQSIELYSGTNIVLRFWADSEKTYSLLSSDSPAGASWSKVSDIFTAPAPRYLAVTNSALSSASRFYRLVSPRQP